MDHILGKMAIVLLLATRIIRFVQQVTAPTADHLMNTEEKRKHLKRKFEELESIESDNKTKLEIAEASPHRRRRKEVDCWLTNVKEVREEVRIVQQREGRSRWNIVEARRINKVVSRVKELAANGKFLGSLVLDVPETRGEAFLLKKMAGRSFQVNVEKLLQWLEKDDVWSIGIYGMGGIGKTTLASHIHNHLLERPENFVRWINVPKDFSIYKLQGEVAKAIRLDLSDEDDLMKRAARIWRSLAKWPQVLLIFDNLWNHFTPKDVGIPIAEGCKMILTTRSFEVCRMMCCENTSIRLERLSEIEAWSLFTEKLGNYADLPPQVKVIARTVARRCSGLPLRLVTIAGSLMGTDDLSDWRNVLEEMKESNFAAGGEEDEVLATLQISYTQLKDPTARLCFLHCALFPHGCKIKREDLIDYMIDEGIINGQSRQAAFDKGHSVLNKLQNASMLEGSTGRGNIRYVEMNDPTHDMALKVIKETQKFMVAAGKKLRQVPDRSHWKVDLERVSLMDNDIREISLTWSPRCPNLSTLLLSRNKNLMFIESSFFKQLCGLKVLDLSHTAIKMLPCSVSNLVCLASLLLGGCKDLWYVPSLEKLKSLTKLDISYTEVDEVPRGLEFLTRLNYLDLYGTKIKELPSEVLPKLCFLQSLMLSQSLKGEELFCLKRLEYLRCHIQEPGDMYKCISRGLSLLESEFKTREVPLNYDLFSGDDDDNFFAFIPDASELGKLMLFKNCKIGDKGDLVAVPKNLLMLYILQCDDATSLCNVALPGGFSNLKFCEINDCQGLEYLISFPQLSADVFEPVEVLRLAKLKNLRVLVKRIGSSPTVLSVGTFSRLKRLELFDCPSMKSLFPASLAPNLRNLVEIVVANCKQMEEIIASDDDEEDGNNDSEESNSLVHSRSSSIALSFPLLQVLKLAYLPELKRLCPGKMICNSVEEIFVLQCEQLKTIPLGLPLLDNGQPSSPPYLKTIIMYPKGTWNTMEWEHPNAKDVLLPFYTPGAPVGPMLDLDQLIGSPERGRNSRRIDFLLLEPLARQHPDDASSLVSYFDDAADPMLLERPSDPSEVLSTSDKASTGLSLSLTG